MIRAAGLTLSLRDFLPSLRQRLLLRPLLLEAATEKRVLDAAREQGLTVSAAELQQAADRFRHRHGLTSAQQTQQWLAGEALTAEDFEAGLERELLVAKLRRHLTQPRVAEHFAAHRDRYTSARLRRILVATEGEARELLAQVRDEGADFAELARQHSLDHASRPAGGNLVVRQSSIDGSLL
jgi:parvulin-like peptidyl-prolyl isomerase